MPKKLFEMVSGNVIGVVEEISAPKYQVDINTIDDFPFESIEDVEVVMRKVSEFVEALLEKGEPNAKDR